MALSPEHPMPAKGTKYFEIIAALLNGDKIDAFWFLTELNLMTGNARLAELRAAGWPIQRYDAPHQKREGETYPVFFMDDHFRRWVREQIDAKIDFKPNDYPFNTGRGKFKIEKEPTHG